AANKELSGVFRSTDDGGTWQSMEFPFTTEVDHNMKDDDDDGQTDLADLDHDAGLHPGHQGDTNFSMAADPSQPNIVYIGGDRQPAEGVNQAGLTKAVARLFRGDFTKPSGTGIGMRWEPLVGVGASGTAPHADSRDLVVAPTGDYLF